MRTFIPILVVLFSFLLSSCSSLNNQVVAKYGDYEVSKDEFRDAYAKSVGGPEIASKDSLAQIKDYLDLYVNYKMKLRDATVRGYDKDEAVIQELEDYKKQIAQTYLEDRFVIKPGLQDLYEKDKYEYKFAHILIKPDTISRKEAYKFAEGIIEKAKAGEDFKDLVTKYSADHATKNSGGEIYYIKPSQLPLPKFIDALAACKIGEVYGKPLLSTAGYHVVKLIEKKPVRYKIRVSHIMRDREDENSKPDTNAVSFLEELLSEIKDGAPFDSLAKAYSEDKGSANNGGDLGFFPRRSMIVSFDSVVFNLKIGQVSDIIETRFGHHIAKCTGEEEYPPLSDIEETLMKFYKKNYYSTDLDEYKIELKNEFNYSYGAALNSFITSKLDSVKLDSTFLDTDLGGQFLNLTACELNNKKYTVGELVNKYMKERRYADKVVDTSLVGKMVNEFTDGEIFELKIADLEKNDKHFKQIIDEYRNGILIFKLQEEEVWSDVKVDSSGLYNYWETVKDQYKLDNRVSYSFIKTKSDSVINFVSDRIQQGVNPDSLFTNIKSGDDITEVGVVDLAAWDKDIPSREASKLEKSGEISGKFKNEQFQHCIVKLIYKENARGKTFEEAYNEIVGPYQELLNKKADNEYTEKLRSLYNPEYNYEALNNLFTSEKN